MFSEGDIVLLRTGKSMYTEVVFVRMSEDIKLPKGTWHSQSPTAVIKRKPDDPEETVLLENLKATN